MVKHVTLVAGVDFGVLILRTCSYTLQFLPSPGYTLDTIRGVSFADICSTCDEIADNLEAINAAADGRGSLPRVQHVTFFGLQCQIEAKTNALWEVMNRAIRIAQDISIHGVNQTQKGVDKIDQEMERRAFCSFFILDSLLSR